MLVVLTRFQPQGVLHTKLNSLTLSYALNHLIKKKSTKANYSTTISAANTTRKNITTTASNNNNNLFLSKRLFPNGSKYEGLGPSWRLL